MAHHKLEDIPRRERVYLPRSVEHVQRLVRHARRHEMKARAAGAQHSVAAAIFGTGPRDLAMLLDGDLRKVEILSEDRRRGEAVVRVGAGCYLGVSRRDPTSTLETSLNYLLDQRGYALPLLGGVTDQSVAGFLQTSSSGGSLTHGLADIIERIELVDGQGEVVTFDRGSDGLNAAAVAMGLLGVVTHVTLRVPARFFVEGVEETVPLSGSLLAGRPGGGYPLAGALREQEYLHVRWFPQKYVQRVIQWSGARAQPHDAPRPYKSPLGEPGVDLLAAAALKLGDALLTRRPDSDAVHRVIGGVMRPFVPLDRRQEVSDVWYRALPADNQVPAGTLLRTHFTEIWLPFEETDRVVATLERMFLDQAVAGNFLVELYGAKRSPFWLSPSYGRDVVRVDAFAWAHNRGRPEDHFAHYWDHLLDIPGARLHWGKYLPRPGQVHGETVFGLGYLRSVYPRLAPWLELRARMDPDRVFLTDYWRSIFEIA